MIHTIYPFTSPSSLYSGWLHTIPNHQPPFSYSSIAEDSKQDSPFCQMREIFSDMIVDMKVDNMLEEVVDEMAREVVGGGLGVDE